MNNLFISPSPHIHSGDSIRKNMYNVIIAMLPAMVLACIYFGLGAFIVTITSIISCLVFEYVIQKFVLNTTPKITDGSALITGILLAFNVPSDIPLWIVILGALVSIGIGKLSFGGLGNNIFNPALVGRVFLLISFPVQMTSWPKPAQLSADAYSGATPLAMLKEGLANGESVTSIMQTSNFPSYKDMFMGNIGGSLGEVAGIAILLGLIYMLIRKTITWHIPVSIIGSVLIFAGILHFADPTHFASPLFHILTGGMLVGAVFMATDYVTSPMSKTGMLIYGIGIGMLTIIIRVFGAYPEGMSFAILIMNAFTPLLNTYFKPKRFGVKK